MAPVELFHTALAWLVKSLGWVVVNWVIISAFANFAIDWVFRVPAASAPEWKAWMEAHPRSSGFVNMFRGGGADVIKLVTGALMVLTAATKHDPASTYPKPNTDGGIE